MTNAQYLINAPQSISCAGNRFCFNGPGSLALSLTERMMEFCKVTVRTKSYDVTIQMKALCLYLLMVLFVRQNFRN